MTSPVEKRLGRGWEGLGQCYTGRDEMKQEEEIGNRAEQDATRGEGEEMERSGSDGERNGFGTRVEG